MRSHQIHGYCLHIVILFSSRFSQGVGWAWDLRGKGRNGRVTLKFKLETDLAQQINGRICFLTITV